MKKTQLILAIVILIMAAYYWFERFDVVTTAFKWGISNAEIGDLILPTILLVIGLVLIFYSPKKKPDEK